MDPTDITPCPDMDYYSDLIGMYLAGRISETIFSNTRYNAGASSDLDVATKYAYDKALNLLKEHSKLVHVLVEKLLENGMLSKLELEEIIKSVEGSGE